MLFIVPIRTVAIVKLAIVLLVEPLDNSQSFTCVNVLPLQTSLVVPLRVMAHKSLGLDSTEGSLCLKSQSQCGLVG